MTKATTIAADATPTGSRRKRRQARCQRLI
jgi:hypothetical protein